MGLNHMNGRVEDAITGRFLSPDPHVPNPGNTQNFNRYSYVNNNPLTFIDPTGFDLCVYNCWRNNGNGTFSFYPYPGEVAVFVNGTTEQSHIDDILVQHG